MRKWIVIGLCVAFLLVVAVLIVVRAGKKSEVDAALAAKLEVTVAVETARATTGPIEETRPFLGKVISTSEVMVFSKIAGKVVSVPAKVGSKVGAGSTIAVIDYDQPGMKFRYYDAYAPIAGEVSAVMVNVGDMVSPAAPLAVVVKPSSVKIQMSVPADTLAVMYKGMPVKVTARGSSFETVEATVANLPASLSAETHMALVEVHPNDKASGLRAGMFATVDVPIARHDNALLVLPSAIRRVSGRDVAYVAAGGVVRLRPVKVGLMRADAVEILEGLKAGDEVICSANGDLADGVKIVKKSDYQPIKN
jgi:multidrug efflux pump subunit AcrA (membrane-fusion protein)